MASQSAAQSVRPAESRSVGAVGSALGSFCPGAPKLGRMSTAARRVRLEAREGRVTGQTAGLAPGHAQANLVILPRDHADDFRAFCERNPRPCPLLEQLDAGAYETSVVADGADVRRDLPRYRVWRDGSLHCECDDVVDLWRDDLVTFLIGCSFSFEEALLQARYR